MLSKQRKEEWSHINYSLNFLGFEDIDLKELDVEENKTSVSVYVTLARSKNIICPSCKSNKLYSYGYKTKVINHKHFTGKSCNIIWKKRRYKCIQCGKTFYEYNPFCLSQKDNYSTETVLYVLEELANIGTFKTVAIIAGLNTKQVIDIFDRYVNIPRESLPKCLGIDEFHNRSTGSGKYACILINNSDSHPSIVDIIEDRTVDKLSYYFQYIGRDERNNVKYFVSDMYEGYRSIHETYFPHSIHIIDTFHFVRLFTEAFNRIRIRIMKSYPTNSQEYDIMKTYWKTLMMPSYKLHTNKTHYQRFGRSLDQKELLNIILSKDEDLYHAYLIKEDFVCNYYRIKYEKAEVYLDRLIDRMKNTGFNEYDEVSRSLRKWKEQIINSFIRDKDGRRITNAMTEGFNNSVKVIKRTSYGYANFKRFRKRILYILRKKSAFKI